MWIATIFYVILVVLGTNKCLSENRKFKNKQFKIAMFVLFVGALVLRVFLAMYEVGHADLQCFGAWARRIVETGPKGFYSANVFTDYPPGYIGVLWVVGILQKVFKTVAGMPLDNLLLKLPAIVFELLTVGFFVKIAKNKIGEMETFLFSAAYLFAPVFVFNSSVWGQVDSIFTFFLVLVMFYAIQGKVEYTYIPFMIGVLIKPQMLMFAPVLLLAIVEHVFLREFSWRKVAKNFWLGMCSLMGSAIYVSFFNMQIVLAQYTDTMSSYPYASVNAYNFWAMIGKNWISQGEAFIGITYRAWGYVGIVLAFLGTAYFWYQNLKKKQTNNYFLLASIFVFTVFIFSVRMHERYLFPMIVLLLFAYLYDRDKNLLIINLVLSLFHLLNVVHVYYYYDPYNYNPKDIAIIGISALTFLSYIGFVIYVFRRQKNKLKDIKLIVEDKKQNTQDSKNTFEEELEELDDSHRKMKRMDWWILIAITFVYACVAFFHLGDKAVPESGLTMVYNEGIYINLPEKADQVKLQFYLGGLENRKFGVYIWDENESEWVFKEEYTMVSVFRWDEYTIDEPCRYICLTVLDTESELLEVAARNAQDELLYITTGENTPQLVDEQYLVPEYRSYLNGTIFDEIYHARTARELLNGTYTYEWTHPPLGKLIMALGVQIFGMNPFGWRFMGTLLGVFMLPIFYIFTKNMFKKTWLAAIVATLFATDFMHFTQTRIATIDVFAVFFIIPMYYFMYRYYVEEHSNHRMKNNWKMLALSGLFMGFAAASKWSGAYAALGIAIIFFIALIQKDWKDQNGGKNRTYKTLLMCLIFFVLVPAIIYVLSYIPVVKYEEMGLLEKVWKDQVGMLKYHQGVHSEHPYSSMFYQWPLVTRPILYYIRSVEDGVGESIAAFGNPLIWWSGIPAFFYLIVATVKDKNKNAMFLVIAYLAQYLPWVFIGRTVFIYHYFPSVPFVILMIGYVMDDLVKKNKKMKKWCYVYTGISILLFVLFYPVLSGYPVGTEYVHTWLKWFDSWTISL